jgi:hypothetical protein
MCIQAEIFADRCDRLHGFLHAARQLVAANSESGEQAWSGVLLLLTEVDDGLKSLEAEVRKCRQAKGKKPGS